MRLLKSHSYTVEFGSMYPDCYLTAIMVIIDSVVRSPVYSAISEKHICMRSQNDNYRDVGKLF